MKYNNYVFVLGNAAFDAFMEQIENSSICLAQQHKLTRNSNESHISEIIKRLTAETRSRGTLLKQLGILYQLIHFTIVVVIAEIVKHAKDKPWEKA